MTTASPPTSRAEFLRRLPECDFAPPDEWVAAPGVRLPLANGSSGAEAVQAFADNYWQLTTDARLERWSRLSAEAASPAVAARLLDLADGLRLETTPHTDPAMEAVAAFCREQFVRGPRERAVARARWLADATPDQRAAVDRLRVEAPAVVQLDPVFAMHAGRSLAMPSTPTSGTAGETWNQKDFSHAGLDRRPRRHLPVRDSWEPPANEYATGTAAPQNPPRAPLGRGQLLSIGAVLTLFVVVIAGVSKKPEPPRYQDDPPARKQPPVRYMLPAPKAYPPPIIAEPTGPGSYPKPAFTVPERFDKNGKETVTDYELQQILDRLKSAGR